jgi:hypothetical protein
VGLTASPYRLTDFTALDARAVTLETYQTNTLMPYMVNTTHDIDALTTSTHANFLSVNRSISDITNPSSRDMSPPTSVT